MDLPTSFYLVAALCVVLTGISKSGFGGGLGVMSVPLMSLYIPPQLAVAILMPILLAMDVLVVWQYRKSWSRPVLIMLVPGAFVGLAIGALVFQAMSADLIRLIIGVLALFFVAQFLLARHLDRPVRAPGRSTVLTLAALSGFSSFVAHAGGPPIKGILLRQGLEKSVFVGTNTVFFFMLNAIKTVAYTSMGQLTEQTLSVSLWLAPLVLVGVGAGAMLHRFISPTIFVRVVYGFLALAGVKLLWDGSAFFLS